jgi:hypothetical protein
MLHDIRRHGEAADLSLATRNIMGHETSHTNTHFSNGDESDCALWYSYLRASSLSSVNPERVCESDEDKMLVRTTGS